MQLIRSGLSILFAALALTLSAQTAEPSLRIEVDRDTLNVGDTVAIRVFLDSEDVTAHPSTRYSVEQPNVGSVSATGLVTATAPGELLVVAQNTSFDVVDDTASVLFHVTAPEDRDNDGLPDTWEAKYGLNSDDAADAEADSDGDTLDNLGEYRAGTDPKKTDTDADGVVDGDEVTVGRNPLVAEKFVKSAMNENCVVSILNRTAQVRADGSWVLPNVPANFGQVRARGTCVENGVTRSGQSAWFTVPADGIVKVADIVFENVVPTPASLAVTSPVSSLSSAGATAQLVVLATYSDGATADLSRAVQGTTWASSNPAIATVGANGLVTAVSSGTVLINAVNDGAIGMLRLTVATSGDSDGDGLPDSYETAQGLNPNDPSDASGDLDDDSLSNLEEFRRGTDPRVADTDLDGLKDGDEIQRGTNPLLADSDGDGVPDGLEVQSNTDPLDRNSYDLRQALQSITITPAATEIVVNTLTGEGSRRVTVTGLLRDGRTLDLTTRGRGTTYSSSDLQVLNFGAADGELFGGSNGTAVLTVSNSGITATATITVRNFPPTALAYVSLPGFANDVDVAGNHAYVAAGAAGLVVVDVTNRAEPKIVKTLALSGNANGIRAVGGRVYVAGGSAGVHVIDVTTPTAARLLGTIDTPGEAWDLAVAGDRVYVADGDAGLQIVDAADPARLHLLGSLDTPGTAKGVDVNGDGTAVVADGGNSVIVDVRAPGAPRLLGTAQTADARDVLVDGTTAYVADFTSSLRVVDFSTPSAPRIVASTASELGGYPMGVAKAGEFVFAAEVFFVNGVPVTSVASPAAPVVRARLDFPQRDDDGMGIAVDHQFVYLAANRGIYENGTEGDSRLYVGQYLSVEDTAGIAPQVLLTSPRQMPTAFEGTLLKLAADATDDILVARVDFVVNGQVVRSDSAAPFEASYRVPAGSPTLTIEARAYDVAGNTATSARITINVLPDPRTTVTGSVRMENDTPVAGAAVECHGVAGTSAADGTFSIGGVPTVDGPVVCVASTVDPKGVKLSGRSEPVAPVAGGVTAAGAITFTAPPKSGCGEPQCVQPDGAYISHFTGPNCTGTESYYLPYDGFGFKCRPWDGQGECGTIRRTVTNRSARQWNGQCFDAWPGGNTLSDFVTVYRGGTPAPYTLAPRPDERYPDDGAELTDGVTETGESWINAAGWIDANPGITLDLGELQSVTEARLYAGNSFGDGTFGVYRPAQVHVSVSRDGENYTSAGSLTFTPHAAVGTKEQVDLGTLTMNAAARFVRYDVTAGGPWVMVTEIAVTSGSAPTTTTATGSVLGFAALPVAGATVSCGGVAGTTAANGLFSIDGVPAGQNVVCTAQFTAADGTNLEGTSNAVPAVVGGVTPVGLIVVQPKVAGACGEAECVQSQGMFVSHFSQPGCKGTESYYLPYDGYAFTCRTWDGKGQCGTIRRTVTNTSVRVNGGPCQDEWPNGNTLDDFVTIYR